MVQNVKRFADRLRDLREQAGLSQYAVAKLSGLSKQALSRLELGENEPSWDTVQRLAVALGVSCDMFVNPDIRAVEPTPGAAGRGRPHKPAAAEGAARPKRGKGK